MIYRSASLWGVADFKALAARSVAGMSAGGGDCWLFEQRGVKRIDASYAALKRNIANTLGGRARRRR